MACSANPDKLSTGYIRLYRSFFEDETSPIQECRAFTKQEAKLDLLLSVRGTQQERLFDGKLITVERGSQVFSYSFFAQRWRWTIKKVRGFLGNLRTRGYITMEAGKKGTLITIVNYNEYNPLPKSGAQERTVEGTTRARKGQEYNKGNKGKKEKGDPRVNEFLTWFCLEYEKARGVRYIPTHGKDETKIKEILVQGIDLEVMQKCALKFLYDTDKFVAGTDRGIGVFRTQFMRYFSQNGHKETKGLPLAEY